MKYFPVTARYSPAKALCQAEGGNLIKIDSKEKFDIFKDNHGMLIFCNYNVNVKRFKNCEIDNDCNKQNTIIWIRSC